MNNNIKYCTLKSSKKKFGSHLSRSSFPWISPNLPFLRRTTAFWQQMDRLLDPLRSFAFCTPLKIAHKYGMISLFFSKEESIFESKIWISSAPARDVTAAEIRSSKTSEVQRNEWIWIKEGLNSACFVMFSSDGLRSQMYWLKYWGSPLVTATSFSHMQGTSSSWRAFLLLILHFRLRCYKY